MTAMGVGIGGWLLYSAFKNRAAAQGTPAGGMVGPGLMPGGTYSPGSLNASVPGVSFDVSPLDPSILRSTLTAVPAVTASQVAQAQSFWSTLSPVIPPSSGYIVFPSGSQAAATLFGGGNTAMDGNGNLYVQWAGQVYQLGAQDSAGNYPATRVS